MTGSTKVAVGVSTLAGYSTSAVTLAGAVAAYVAGDRSQDTLVVILLGGYSAVSFLVTQVGRYVQAHAQVKAAPSTAGAVAWGSPPPLIPSVQDVPLEDPEFTPDPDPPDGPDSEAASALLDRTGARA